VIGVAALQDVAVVPLLVLLPALAEPRALGPAVLAALGKRRSRLPWSCLPGPRSCAAGSAPGGARSNDSSCSTCSSSSARRVPHAARGLSLVLGAFLAGMLISETEYRFQVEEDIRPYRDVLLGLFFVTVGMLLDLRVVAAHAGLVAVLFIALAAQVRADRAPRQALPHRRRHRAARGARARERRRVRFRACCRSPARRACSRRS